MKNFPLGSLSFAFVLALGLVGGVAQAQKPGVYAAEPVVLERLETVFRMAADGTGVQEQTVVAHVQTEAAVKEYGVVTAAYAGNSQRVDFDYVRVRRPDGTVVATSVDDALEMPLPVTQAAPFYSDLKQKQLPVRNLRVGDTLEWKVRIVRTKAEAEGQFWGQETFATSAVALHQVLELRVPASETVTVWSPEFKPVKTTEGAETVYRWDDPQLKPTVGPEAEAAKELKKKAVWTPAQELDWREGKLPDVAWTTFKDWAAVGAWYRGLEGDRTTPDAAIKAKVAELTAGKNTEQAKIDAVYEYVSRQVRYIGVAFGIGRYQPHHAGDVFENQYGDCKDKHTLLAAMLQQLGLHPDAVLIGYAIRFNPALPSPEAFNHAITQVEVEGKPVWLDSTAGEAPYGDLARLLRDRPALVVPDTGTATIERTPKNLPFASFQTWDAAGSLDKEGTSNTHITLTLRGDEEVEVRQAFAQLSSGQYGDLVQRLANALGYAGTTSHPELLHLDNPNEPLAISFDYKRDLAADWANLRILPQLAPNPLPRPDVKDPPVAAIELGVPRVETSTAAMKLPAGWGAELPEAVHGKSAWAIYDQTYRLDKGTVYTTRRVEVLAERVPQADWKGYSKFAEAADFGNDNYIVLSRAHGEKATLAEPAADATPAKLVQEAFGALQQHDNDAAQKLLERVAKQSPEENLLWAGWGALHSMRQQWPEATEAYQKELKLHPESYRVYPALVDAEQRAGKTVEEEATLRSWRAAQPDELQPARELVMVLERDGKHADAVATGRAAEKQLPADKRSDAAFQIALGKAELAVPEDKDAGHKRLVALLDANATAATQNDASYELADAGVELPLAEDSTRKALASMDATGQDWTLATLGSEAKRQVQLESAAWDTMGWILFKQGKPAEALLWLKPAWKDSPNRAKAQHLGEAYAAVGDAANAKAAFETARMLEPAGDAAAQKAWNDERIAAIKKGDFKKVVPDGSFGQSHPVPLGKANGLNGSSEYKLLLRAGRVVEVEPTGGSEVKGGAARVRQTPVADLFPPGSNATLMRAGVLNCYAGNCTIYLED